MLLENDRARLQHMLAAVCEILHYCSHANRGDLDSNTPLLRLVERNIEILGEAASRLSESYKLTHSEVPWNTITGMRNRIAHAYFNLNRDVLWNTIQTRIPELEQRLLGMLEEFEQR